MTKCGCTGCGNEATNTWSGHPTCNKCSSSEWRRDIIDTPFEARKQKPYMPQVGEECEVDHGDDWIKCLYLGIDVYGNHAYQISKGVYKGEFNACSSIENFRPLETEREKFIIEGIDDLKEINPFESQGGLLGMLFDKGYRKNQRCTDKQRLQARLNDAKEMLEISRKNIFADSAHWQKQVNELTEKLEKIK
jgi:hypothetical protein